jgi:hypothetical protein
MLKGYANVSTSPVIYCYAFVDSTDVTCVVGHIYIYIYDTVFFLFQLGAFRAQNLERSHVGALCILVQVTPFQSCVDELQLQRVNVKKDNWIEFLSPNVS